MAILVVSIPGNIMPTERGERFADPMVAALTGAGLHAKVVGGGSLLGGDDGMRRVVACDVEIEVNNVARAVQVLRRALVDAGAPHDTVIRHFDEDADGTYSLVP